MGYLGWTFYSTEKKKPLQFVGIYARAIARRICYKCIMLTSELYAIRMLFHFGFFERRGITFG